MAAQQAQIAETIRAMKLALNRRVDDDSGSDDEAPAHSNRGTKMKRSARFARYDHLDNTGGLAYRKRARHADYTRAIISTNPPLYDSEGELVSPYLSEDERVGEPLREDPFAGVQLEALLKPLTSVDALVEHPSLALPFQSAGLRQLVNEAATMLRAQKDALWRAKRLLKRLEGDADWAPCAMFETEADILLLNRSEDAASLLQDVQPQHNGVRHAEDEPDKHWGTNGRVEEDAIPSAEQEEETTGEDMISRVDMDTRAALKVDAEMLDGNEEQAVQADTSNDRQASAEPTASETASLSTAANMHAMTTRARARSPRASASPSPSPSDSASVPNVNPWFMAPSYTLPDRDLGLPADEAESTRKLLLLYCQKQEQIIRSLEVLYSGLQRGDRLRKHIYESAKASAHLVPDGKGDMVTSMADGEDWYDEEEYGVLEKGKDEAEDVEDENRRGGRRRRVVGRVNG